MKKHFLLWDNPCQAIYMLMFVLIVVGGINVFSASYVTAREQFGSALYYLGRYFVFALLGLIFMYIFRRIGYKRLLHPRLLWLGYLVVVAMLVAVDAMGIVTKGAARWLYVGPISIQPSECAKLLIIMLAARYLGRTLEDGRRVSLFSGGGLYVVMAAVSCAVLVYKQPDLGTAAIILGLMLGVFIIAGLPKFQIFCITCLGMAGAVLGVMLFPYRLERVKVWFDPWLDEARSGYQMVQAILAIGSGGLSGTDWGHGTGKFFYLPEAHTDFAFAIFCQENGFIGALLLLFVFTLLAAAFCAITFSTRDRKGFLLAGGITFLIIGQAFANMAMVCGIFPVIGVPLIFISYGGSSMLISMIAIGLLMSVYDVEKVEAEYDAMPPEVRRQHIRFTKSSRRWRR